MLYRILKAPSVVYLKVGGWALAAMMLLTFADVFGRNALNRPIIGSFEITECLMAILAPAGMAYVTITKAQIRVEVLIKRLPQRAQSILYIITTFITLCVCAVLAWRSFVATKTAYVGGSVWGILLIPTYPFVFVVSLGITLLGLSFLAEFISSLQGVKKWK